MALEVEREGPGERPVTDVDEVEEAEEEALEAGAADGEVEGEAGGAPMVTPDGEAELLDPPAIFDAIDLNQYVLGDRLVMVPCRLAQEMGKFQRGEGTKVQFPPPSVDQKRARACKGRVRDCGPAVEVLTAKSTRRVMLLPCVRYEFGQLDAKGGVSSSDAFTVGGALENVTGAEYSSGVVMGGRGKSKLEAKTAKE